MEERQYVDAIDQQIMYAEKSWGNYQVIDVSDASLTIKVTLHSGHSMRYHSHARRDEVWTVISGRGRAYIDDQVQQVKPGDVLAMPAGSRHTIVAETELQLIEVQVGEEITVADKQVYPNPY